MEIIKNSRHIPQWGRISLNASVKGVVAIILGDSHPKKPEGKVSAINFRKIEKYLQGQSRRLDFKIFLDRGTPFQRRVWRALRLIPYGETRSYAWVARTIRRPKAVRAVGQACGANPLPLYFPCHRVVAADGKIGGFSSGLQWKRDLLKLEATLAKLPSTNIKFTQ